MLVPTGARCEPYIVVENVVRGDGLVDVKEYIRPLDEGRPVEHIRELICAYTCRRFGSSSVPSLEKIVSISRNLKRIEAAISGEPDIFPDRQLCEQVIDHARQRLVHALFEHEHMVAELPTKCLDLVTRVYDEYEEEPDELDLIEGKNFDLMSRWSGPDAMQSIVNRKCRNMIFIRTGLSQAHQAILNEASNAFCAGLYRGAVSLCRCHIDSVLGHLYGLDLGKFNLFELINRFSEDYSQDTLASAAHGVRRLANDVLHRGRDIQQEEAAHSIGVAAELATFNLNRCKDQPHLSKDPSKP